ncbi:flavin-binding monooxygenase [Apiospora arundinis]|uniref:Flavin-binding monooxygenase n=1 Tax=Apiospora arundinis TaxID=335852 RepID=A0ABR2I885_9PEZI
MKAAVGSLLSTFTNGSQPDAHQSRVKPRPMTLKDVPIENQRPMKVRVIGAGYSGIYLGIRIPQRLRNFDLKIYDKNEGVGGTWFVNRYPGCACDVPSHSYQYSFDPNPDWSNLYAPQREICAYLQRMATKYGVMRFVKLSHEVESCQWDEEAKKWHLKVRELATGKLIEDDADVVIAAKGNLSDPAWPDIPGFKDFEGEVMHSARWKENYDFKNKRIGVIGNGSSAIQIVPNLQKIEGTHLSCFVRSKTWITNPFGDAAMVKLGLDPKQLGFSEEQRAEFAKNPEKFYAFRKVIEDDGNTIHEVSFRDSAMQRGALELFRTAMRERLAAKPEIADFLIPSFAIGCRRTTPGPGYLEALVESNVDFVTDGIGSINAKGVKLRASKDDNNGKQVDLDVLVCATGFQTASAPPFLIQGRGGQTLKDRFVPHPEAYLSVAVDGFPNLFFMLGPNSAIGSGSLTRILESEGDYIVKCLRKLQREDYACMTVKADRVADWSAYCATYFKNTVYTDPCNSWYRSGDRITGLWPGSTLHALEAMRAPRWEDFEFENLEGAEVNSMKWLGNGWSVTQLRKEEPGTEELQGDPSWYLEPRFLDVPVEGTPEEDPEFKLRPFY